MRIGHSYLCPKSACSIKIIQEYFDEGRIPDRNEVHCGSDVDTYFMQEGDVKDTLEDPIELAKKIRGIRRKSARLW